MDLGKETTDFMTAPFDFNRDGKTSVLELFAGVGLVFAIVFAWARVLNLIFASNGEK